MIRSLITALALSTLCIPQVHAAEVYTENNLLEDFQAMGGRVYVDSQLCDEYKGAYGLQAGPTVHLCTEPHNGDTAEWKDTIRHEVFHVVQYCNGGPLTNSAASMIAEAYAKGWTEGSYKPDSWHLEAEAHYVAATKTAKEISNALFRFCS